MLSWLRLWQASSEVRGVEEGVETERRDEERERERERERREREK